MALIAEILGGVVAVFILTAIAKKLLKKWISGVNLIYISSLLSAFLAITLGAFGNANGGSLQWGHATLVYIPAQIIVLVIFLGLHIHKQEKPKKY